MHVNAYAMDNTHIQTYKLSKRTEEKSDPRSNFCNSAFRTILNAFRRIHTYIYIYISNYSQPFKLQKFVYAIALERTIVYLFENALQLLLRLPNSTYILIYKQHTYMYMKCLWVCLRVSDEEKQCKSKGKFLSDHVVASRRLEKITENYINSNVVKITHFNAYQHTLTRLHMYSCCFVCAPTNKKILLQANGQLGNAIVMATEGIHSCIYL